MTSGLETEWDYSGRKERDGQKKKIVKANEKSKKEEKTRKWKDKGERGAPAPRGASSCETESEFVKRFFKSRGQRPRSRVYKCVNN